MVMIMKLMAISLLLFVLTTGIIVLMDLLQGFSIFQSIYAFVKLKRNMVKEDYILVFVFFLPLIISKLRQIVQKIKTT